MACDEDNRRMLCLCDLPLQVEAVDVWQFDVEDEAGRHIWLVRALVVAGGTECDGPHILRLQQFTARPPTTFVVAHHANDPNHRHHDPASDYTGQLSMNYPPPV